MLNAEALEMMGYKVTTMVTGDADTHVGNGGLGKGDSTIGKGGGRRAFDERLSRVAPLYVAVFNVVVSTLFFEPNIFNAWFLVRL